MKDPARMYREVAVRGASPVGLIVILYQEIIRSIRRAQRAQAQNNIEQRALALSHAVEVIGYLQSILNMEAGGEVARNLSQFYNAMRAQTLEANLQGSDELMESLGREFANLAEAWLEVDRTASQESSGDSTAVPATPSAGASDALGMAR
ncbi:MAG: flagellar export chaperone FliS [Acidobacteriia bacterium]|nr:flagellar export chaperone FliS [Terriglobia bacterium]